MSQNLIYSSVFVKLRKTKKKKTNKTQQKVQEIVKSNQKKLIKKMENPKKFSPDINSFGICFFPDVVIRYNEKSSTLSTIQDVINLAKLFITCCFVGDIGVLGDWSFKFVVLLFVDVFSDGDGVCWKFGVRSSGAWLGGRFGLLKFNNSSRNVLRDCSSQIAGGTVASLYLEN